jgi:hypothetical protein
VNERGLEFIESWLKDKESEESEIYNYEKIRSVGLLKELTSWNPDPNSNFDRISAAIMLFWFDISLGMAKDREPILQARNKKYGNYFDKFKQKPDPQRIMWDKYMNPNNINTSSN